MPPLTAAEREQLIIITRERIRTVVLDLTDNNHTIANDTATAVETTLRARLLPEQSA